MQDSLPAGGLRLYREGVEPSESLRKVSGHIPILLSRTSPVARAFYAKDGERGRVRALQLVEAHLRMRIGRPIINEIRDGEAALAFLRMNASGHPGGITTMHAPNARGALNTLRIMLKQTDEGRAVSDQDLVDRLRESIDVIIHCDRSPENGFGMPEVYFAASELAAA